MKRLKLVSEGAPIDHEMVDEAIGDCCSIDPKTSKRSDQEWILDGVCVNDVDGLKDRMGAIDPDWHISVVEPLYYTFDQQMDEDAIYEALEILDVQDPFVETMDPHNFAIFTSDRLDEDLTVRGVAGRRCQSSIPDDVSQQQETMHSVWFHPFFSEQDATQHGAAWKEKIEGSKLFANTPGFLGAQVNHEKHALGITFASHEQAQAFLALHKGKIKMTLPGDPKFKAKEYSMTQSLREEPIHTAQVQSPCSAPAYGASPGSVPPNKIPLHGRGCAEDLNGRGRALQREPEWEPCTDGGTAPDAMPASPHAQSHGYPSLPQHPAREAAALPPLQPNKIRVHGVDGGFVDVAVNPCDCMGRVYEATEQQRGPGGILVSHPAHAEAIPRTGPVAAFSEVALCPCSSVPIILPTEVHAHGDEADIGFAQIKEMLCEFLGEYQCISNDGTRDHIFKHREKHPHRNLLIPMKKLIMHLDTVIQNRKVCFLSAVGKPREGKSTLLALIDRHFARQRGGAQNRAPPFHCSDSEKRSCTAGLWVSTEELTRGGLDSEDAVVLLLDSEGLFAADGSDPEYFVRLFTITVVLSSCVIFNNKISNIVAEEFSAPIARLSALYRGFCDRNEWIREQRPTMIYLARDWNYPQNLVQDQGTWDEAERLACGGRGKDQELEGALQFARNTFCPLRFATLPTPVDGPCKTRIATGKVSQHFQAKFEQIVGEILSPALIPKSFRSAAGQDTFIRGSAPLLQLVSSTLDAVGAQSNASWNSLDWQTIVAGFLQESAVHRLDHEVQSIVKSAEARFSSFRISVDAFESSTLRIDDLRQAGLKITREPCEILVQGTFTNIEAILTSPAVSTVDVRLHACTHVQQFLKEGVDNASAKLQGVSGQPQEELVKTLSERVQTLATPLLQFVDQMAAIVAEASVNRLKEHWETNLCEVATEKQVETLYRSTLKGLHRLQDKFNGDLKAQNIVHCTEAFLDESKSNILARPRDVVRAAVERHFAQALRVYCDTSQDSKALGKASLDTPRDTELGSVEDILSSLPGDVLFSGSCAAPTAGDVKLAHCVRDALSCDSEPALVSKLPRSEIQRCTAVECDRIEHLVQQQKHQRLWTQIYHLFGPLGLPCDEEDGVVSELLAIDIAHVGVDARIVDILKKGFRATHIDDGVSCNRMCNEARRRSQEEPLRSHSVGHSWAKHVTIAFESVCQWLMKSVCADFQIALPGQSKERLQACLTEVGIEYCSVDPFGSTLPEDSRPWFRVLLPSQHVMDNFLHIRENIGFKPFQECGWRPPPVGWVAPYSQAAEQCWKPYLDRATTAELFLTREFENMVAENFPNSDSFVAYGEHIVALKRHCVVCYPVRFRMTEEILRKVTANAKHQNPVVLGEVVIVVVHAVHTVLKQLQQVATFTDSNGERQNFFMRMPFTEEWAWFEPQPQLAHAWNNIKSEVLGKIREDVVNGVQELRQGGDHCYHEADMEHQLRLRTQGLLDKHGIVVDTTELDLLLRRIFNDVRLLDMNRECSIISLSLMKFAGLHELQEDFPGPIPCTQTEQSREDVVRLSIEPVLKAISNHIHACEDSAYLSQLAARTVKGDSVLSQVQRQLQSDASIRAQEINRHQLCEQIARLFGIREDWRQQFLHDIYDFVEDYRSIESLARTIYKYHGRRFVPGIELQSTFDEAANIVRKICSVFADLDECCVRFQQRSNPQIHDKLFACRWVDGDEFYFLQRSADVEWPTGFEMVRQLKCHLLTTLPFDEAFKSLDHFRPRAFVTAMDEKADGIHATLAVWHIHVCSLALPSFRLLRMKRVPVREAVKHELDLYQISDSQALLFAASFETTTVAVPAGLSPHAQDLNPSECELPLKVPEQAIDVDVLISHFAYVGQASIDALAGREWCSLSCAALMDRCANNQAALHAIRVLVMSHTRAICDAGKYYTHDKSHNVSPPTRTTSHANLLRSSNQFSQYVRFEETRVMVTNADTLTAAQHAHKNTAHGRPLVLNMANRCSPGGGYKKGSSAQEEDLFRRTNLSSALVEEHCGGRSAPSYPLEELTPIISHEVLVFRGQEQDGYPLLEAPYQVDVLTVPAYNGNPSRGGQEEHFRVVEKGGGGVTFTDEGLSRTTCNIYTTLAAAAEHGADHLVLGALGCGAFSNPPSEVSAIFAELLPCFAGCFRIVEFAIFDSPHQRGGNFAIFEEALPRKMSRSHSTQWLRSMDHPDVCPRLGFCKELGDCRGCQRRHPNRCRLRDCENSTRIHQTLWQHKQQCSVPNCPIMFGPDSEKKNTHQDQYEHLEVCNKEHCKNPQHLHPPPCRHGPCCPEQGKRHRDGHWYSHGVTSCPQGTCCSKWRDQEHLRLHSHPFLTTPCEEAVWCQRTSDEKHCALYSHVCQWGANECPSRGDPNHERSFIHMSRPACPEGASCGAYTRPHYSDHLTMFQHPKAQFHRPVCKKGSGCRQRMDHSHIRRFIHATSENELPLCSVWGHNTIRHLMEERQTGMEVHFHGNAKGMISRVKEFFTCKEDPHELKAASDLFRNFRAVHRLSVEAFGKVIITGFLASIHCLQTHSQHPDFAMMLPTVAKAISDHPNMAGPIQEAVEAMVHYSIENGRARAPNNDVDNSSQFESQAIGGAQAQIQRSRMELQRRKGALRGLPKEEVAAIEFEAQQFLTTMHELEQIAMNPGTACLGIAHDKDRQFETNKMTFAIFGPHTLNYGEDKDDEHCEGVHLVFSPAALHHPDVFVTPMAATFYGSGHGDKHRPWWFPAKKGDPFESMASEKLHPSSPLFHEALAWEFLARAAQQLGKPLKDVSVKCMLQYWKEQNAHHMAECHFPYVTPLSMVELAIISQHSFNKLPQSGQARTRKLFGTRLKIVAGKSAEAQWKAAMAHLPMHLHLPHAFAFSVVSTRGAEVVLPSVLGKKGLLFFRASSPHFSVTVSAGLDSTCVPKEPYTFTVSGLRCVATKASGLSTAPPIAVNDKFNCDLLPDQLPVMYCLEFDTPTGTLTLRHAGASRTLNGETLVITGVRIALQIAVFTVRGTPVAFTDVRVLKGGEDNAYEYERTHTVQQVAPHDPAPFVSVPLSHAESDKTDSWAARAASYLPFVSTWLHCSGAKPFCPEGMRCIEAYQTAESKRTDSQNDHLNKYRHLCLYGKSCNKRGEVSHEQQYVHLEKQTCSARHCALLGDVLHRSEFHHPEKWDLLVQCRDGETCRHKDKPWHREKFYHTDIGYAIDDSGVHVRPEKHDMDVDTHPDTTPARRPGNTGGSCDGQPRASRPAQAYDFTGIDVEVQDSVDDMADIYNLDAVNGDYGRAQFDEYGNPVGGGFDLAQDGAFKGFRLLIGCFYLGEGLPSDLRRLTLPELQKKGWEADIKEDVGSFTTALQHGRYHVAWVISGDRLEGDAAAFVREVRRFHESGRGLMIFGDNDPFYAHANTVLPDLSGFSLTGNTPGGKEMAPGSPELPGKFGKHLICSGIQKLHEGVTICYPEPRPKGWDIIGTSSNGKPVLLAKDAAGVKAGPGRIVVDTGFTKLMQAYWTTAGTPRYVSNCSAWLALRERFKGPKRGFNEPPPSHA